MSKATSQTAFGGQLPYEGSHEPRTTSHEPRATKKALSVRTTLFSTLIFR